MARFVLTRLVQSLAALAILSVVVFVLARATGDPLHLILPMSASEEDFANARKYLGLDRPYVAQYLSFVGRALTGDFGTSLRARRPVGELIAQRLPNSLRLAAFAMTVSLLLAFPLGMLAAAEVFLLVRGRQGPYCAKLHHHNNQRCIFRCNFEANH